MRIENGELIGTEQKRPVWRTVQNTDDGFSETVETTIPNTRDDGGYLIIEVMFESGAYGANSHLDMTIEGLADGDYNYRHENEMGNVTSETGANEYRLIETTSAEASDRQFVTFRLYGDSITVRPIVSRVDAAPARTGEGQWLRHGYADVTLNGADNLTFSANGDVRAHIAVFRVPNRGEIF